MNKKTINIEQLYRESFNNFRVEPSSGLWKNISSKLALKTFFTFTPSTFNAYYLSAILALFTAGALWITKPPTDNNQIIKEIYINKTIETPIITPVQENETEQKEVTTQKESRNPEAGSQKSEVRSQKSTPGTQNPVPNTQNPELVTPDPESITLNPKPVAPILEPVTRNPELVTPKLATTHPKPKTQNTPSTQYQAPSTDLPDPWPNIDSLFTNQTPTPPQHSIQFPNAFTPNANGPTNGYYTPGIPNNDVFHPVYKGVVEYHLSIFNRRGVLIFESNDINVGWDGYINDRLAAQGIYVWKARGKYSNGENFTKLGNIMLIKK